MDILGVVMALVGILTLLSLFSAKNGSLTGYWISALKSIFGWGTYILPIGLIVLGSWLVARNIDRLPALSIERIFGIVFLFIGLLVTFHSLSGPALTALDRARAGTGGGYIGGYLQAWLFKGIGPASTGILVLAWLLITLAMTLDISMQEMFKWAGPLYEGFKKKMSRPIQKPVAGSAPAPTAPGEPPSDDFIPLNRPMLEPKPAYPPGVAVRTNLSSGQQIVWRLPRVSDILEPPQITTVNAEFVQKRAALIEETLASFGAPAKVVDTSTGPSVTMFGVEPQFVESRNGQTRVRVAKIAGLADDLALALAAPRIRIQAPVPGRGYVGIEVPNDEMSLVALREVVESDVFTRSKYTLRFALGKDVAGHPKVSALESMPHLLIAGTTGSGKSVCVNSILTCLLLNNTPMISVSSWWTPSGSN